MTPTVRRAALAALLALPCLTFAATAEPIPSVVEKARPHVQIALLLDTSSSMDGLIGQAKEQLWKMVNTFRTAKRDGQAPVLQIALYEYGKDSLPRQSGFIRQVLPFTTDLDRVSEELFRLQTNGGDEYCGKVIQTASQQLDWSKSKEDLKLIYIAGNEPFNQGPVDYRAAVKGAQERGITVNTIHCGTEGEGISGHWKDGAALVGGNFLTIDQNRAVARVITPQDAEIARLGAELNKTYLGYGGGGAAGKLRQAEQDDNAASMSKTSAATRAVAKASGNYDNSGWDLVDATKKGKVKLEDVKADALPEPLKALPAAERAAFVEKKAQERKDLQEKINALDADRTAYLAKQAAAAPAAAGPGAPKPAATLDEAMIESVKEQAKKSAYSF